MIPPADSQPAFRYVIFPRFAAQFAAQLNDSGQSLRVTFSSPFFHAILARTRGRYLDVTSDDIRATAGTGSSRRDR